jgi:hypothetical protein
LLWRLDCERLERANMRESDIKRVALGDKITCDNCASAATTGHAMNNYRMANRALMLNETYEGRKLFVRWRAAVCDWHYMNSEASARINLCEPREIEQADDGAHASTVKELEII